ncbi:MAG: UDP-glucose 4-epimerase GalE [Rhodospirillaceae bacterium]
MSKTGIGTMGRVVVTGGAGYIGSHAVLALRDAGWDVVIVDDLSTGSLQLVPRGVPLRIGNIGNSSFMASVFAETRPDAVIHFAGSISVPESVERPLKYYNNNFANTCRLVETCLAAGIDKFIFSSTAAVYGIPEVQPVAETSPLRPINPYGRSKLMTEEMLKDTAAAAPFRYVALRYFNVAGADPKGRAGQVVQNSTNLIKVVSELAANRRAGMTVYGNDYATPDGTCIRDFIHVSDLADAHVAALTYLMKGGDSDIMNCGYGEGYSVTSVLREASRIAGRKLPYVIGPRRAGDPAQVVSDPARIRDKLAWTPRYNDLDLILRSAIAWEKSLPVLAERETEAANVVPFAPHLAAMTRARPHPTLQ